ARATGEVAGPAPGRGATGKSRGGLGRGHPGAGQGPLAPRPPRALRHAPGPPRPPAQAPHLEAGGRPPRQGRRLVLSFIFNEAMRDLRRAGRVGVSAILLIALSLTALGGFWLLSLNLGRAIDQWGDRVRVVVFLKDDPPPGN